MDKFKSFVRIMEMNYMHGKFVLSLQLHLANGVINSNQYNKIKIRLKKFYANKSILKNI